MDELLLPKKNLSQHLYCNATTLKGNKCKNKVKNLSYCKRHSKQFSLEKPIDCPICMEKLLESDLPIKCGHWIHKECLLQWKENICPLCRTPITFTKKEMDIKYNIHNKETLVENESPISDQILELILSLTRGVPSDIQEIFLIELLNIDIENDSVFFGIHEDYNEDEYNNLDIDDLPDFIE